jgi:hypothetical protein
MRYLPGVCPKASVALETVSAAVSLLLIDQGISYGLVLSCDGLPFSSAVSGDGVIALLVFSALQSILVFILWIDVCSFAMRLPTGG